MAGTPLQEAAKLMEERMACLEERMHSMEQFIRQRFCVSFDDFCAQRPPKTVCPPPAPVQYSRRTGKPVGRRRSKSKPENGTLSVFTSAVQCFPTQPEVECAREKETPKQEERCGGEASLADKMLECSRKVLRVNLIRLPDPQPSDISESQEFDQVSDRKIKVFESDTGSYLEVDIGPESVTCIKAEESALGREISGNDGPPSLTDQTSVPIGRCRKVNSSPPKLQAVEPKSAFYKGHIFPSFRLKPCPVCGKKLRARNLHEHLRNHRMPKRYKCDLCGKRLSSNGSWNRHRRSHFQHDHPFRCQICDKGFNFKSNFQLHLRKVHGHQKGN